MSNEYKNAAVLVSEKNGAVNVIPMTAILSYAVRPLKGNSWAVLVETSNSVFEVTSGTRLECMEKLAEILKSHDYDIGGFLLL